MSNDKLPDGWTWVKFGDVVRNVNENSLDLEGDGIDRVVGLDHLDPGSLSLVRWDNITDLPDGTTFTRKFKSGHVLFGKRRAYQRKVAVPDFQGVCSGDILVFEPADKPLLTEFLPYLVQSDGFFDHALGTSAGSLSPRTKWAELAKYEFALPPLDEQQRIVKLLSAADTHVSSLERQGAAARAARSAVLSELLSAGGDDWTYSTLDELVLSGVVTLGRGNVISKKDMEVDPGPYPVYSSAQNNDGRIGSYNKFMFDEELITWSIDGGGHVFYRPHHKFSVTNIGGYLRILDGTKFLYPFLAAVLQKLHSQHVFDWQNKAHPSVIRKLYNNIPLASIEEQRRIVEIISSVDEVIQSAENAVVATKILRLGLLTALFAVGEL